MTNQKIDQITLHGGFLQKKWIDFPPDGYFEAELFKIKNSGFTLKCITAKGIISKSGICEKSRAFDLALKDDKIITIIHRRRFLPNYRWEAILNKLYPGKYERNWPNK